MNKATEKIVVGVRLNGIKDNNTKDVKPQLPRYRTGTSSSPPNNERRRTQMCFSPSIRVSSRLSGIWAVNIAHPQVQFTNPSARQIKRTVSLTTGTHVSRSKREFFALDGDVA
ncbi:hypothetical protein Bca4012_084415 [Brassica carinata]